MSRHSDNCDQKHKAYIDARLNAKDANDIVGSVAVDIAEQFLETGTADATVLAVYEKAKVLAEQKIDEAKVAWAVYDRAYRIMVDQEKEMPSAVAAAEGVAELEIAEIRVADNERMFIPSFTLDSEWDSRSQQEAKWPIGSMDIHPESLATLDLLEDGSKRIRADGRVSIVDDLSAVDDFRHESSLSVGDAPFGASLGTSESTEGDQTPVVSEMKMPSAVAAAEGEEIKTNR